MGPTQAQGHPELMGQLVQSAAFQGRAADPRSTGMGEARGVHWRADELLCGCHSTTGLKEPVHRYIETSQSPG